MSIHGIKQSLEIARESFAAMFEAEGEGYLYRSKASAAPVLITASEYEKFVADFRKAQIFWLWAGCAFSVAVICAGVAIFIALDLPTETPWLAPLVIFAVAIPVIPVMWAFYAPKRALRGRVSGMAGRTKAEVRLRMAQKFDYGASVALVAVTAILLYSHTKAQNLLSGWNLVWVVLSALVVAVAIYFAIMKWRYDR